MSLLEGETTDGPIGKQKKSAALCRGAATVEDVLTRQPGLHHLPPCLEFTRGKCDRTEVRFDAARGQHFSLALECFHRTEFGRYVPNGHCAVIGANGDRATVRTPRTLQKA